MPEFAVTIQISRKEKKTYNIVAPDESSASEWGVRQSIEKGWDDSKITVKAIESPGDESED